MKFLVINGPNLNLLGLREPAVYGNQNYEALCEYIRGVCGELSVDCELYQSNHEGDIVDKIQSAYGKFDGILINPAAYTHTSVAILDALKAVAIPTVEIHLSNVMEREEFRHRSYTSLAAVKTFMGYGFEGYRMAAEFLKNYLEEKV